MSSGPCPKCGSKTEMGYGLAGGGIGPYVFCTREGCDHFEKFQDPETDDPPPEPPKETP
jgi:hypothetical protein